MYLFAHSGPGNTSATGGGEVAKAEGSVPKL